MSKSDLRVYITGDASNFNKNIKLAQGALVKFEGVAKSVGNSIKGTLATAFAIQSAQTFFTTLIDAGRGFEDQMAKVKAVSNAGAKGLKMMRDEAARLGATTMYSASQAAKALENLTRNGLDARKATKALSKVLELAGANAIELAEAADIVTNTMNMFGLEIEDLNKVNDVLSKTTASSATNITDLYEALKYAAPTAALFGIKIEEVNAALGVLANRGVKGSQAGTTLRSILTSLIKPSAEAASLLKQLGIDEVSIKLEGFAKTLDRLKGLSVTAYSTIFGERFGGYAATLIDDNELTKSLTNTLLNSMGTAARMFKDGSGDFNVAINNFKSTFEGTMIKMFDAIKPMLTNTVNIFTELIKVLSDVTVIASAAGAALVGLGTKGAIKLNKEVAATNEQIYTQNKLLNSYKEALSGSSDMLISLGNNKFKSEFIELLQKVKEEAQDAGFPFDELKRKIKNINVGNITALYNKLVKVNELGEEIGERPFGIAELMSADAIGELKQTLKSDLEEITTEIRNGNYFDLGGKELALKFVKEYKEAINDAFKSYNPDNIGKLSEALVEVEELLEKLPKKATIATKGFEKIGLRIAAFGKSLWSLVGGWVGVATIAIPTIVSQFRKAGEAARETTRITEEYRKANAGLEGEFKFLVSQLAKAELNSVAWKIRMEELTNKYPELVKELNLGEVYVNSTSEAFLNLAGSMEKVIEKLKQLNLSASDNAVKNMLNEKYLNNDYDWINGTVLKQLQKRILKFAKPDQEGSINSAFHYIGSVVTSLESNENKLKLITDILKNSVFPATKFSEEHFNAENIATQILRDYNTKAGNQISKLEHLNGKTFNKEAITVQQFDNAVSAALKSLEAKELGYEKDALLLYPDDADKQKDYVIEQASQEASRVVDELIKKFRDEMIEGVSGADRLMDSEAFAAIRSKISYGSTGASGNDDYVEGSISAIKAKIANLEKQLTDWDLGGKVDLQLEIFSLIETLKKELEKLENEQYIIQFKTKYPDAPNGKLTPSSLPATPKAEPTKGLALHKPTPEEMYGSLANIQSRITTIRYLMESTNNDKTIEYLKGELEKLQEQELKIKAKIEGTKSLGETQEALTAVSSAVQAFASTKFEDDGTGWTMWAANVVSSIATALPAIHAAAIALGIMEGTKVPFPANIAAIATTVALIASMFASIPAFASGGIVGGNSTVGDMNLARVNSGEMILNNRQLRNLFNLLNGNGSIEGINNSVEFKIKGTELVGVLNNYNNKRNKVR